MASLSGAKTFPSNPALERGVANKLLSAVAGGTNGSGDEFGITASGCGKEEPQTFGIQSIVDTTSGSFTSFNIDIEGSLDGSNWTKLGSLTNVAGEFLFIANQKIRFIRANKTTDAVAAGTPAVTVLATV